MNYSSEVKNKFAEIFDGNPLMIYSPGRINLIGEHTDYNMGFVMPAAIDKAVYFAIAPNGGSECRLHAFDLNDNFTFTLETLKYSEKHWPNYLMGVVDQLQKMNHKISGFDCVFGGNIPIGAGLSSSAAIEAGLAFSLNEIFNLKISKMELVKLAQRAENEFVGVKCGIMDQYINIFGKSGNVLRIDCRSLEYEYFPFNFENVSIVLYNTMVSHSLASSEYNQRRKECASGVELIKRKYSGVVSLRDVPHVLLEEFRMEFDPVVYKRCKYVVEEIERVISACDSLTNGDLKSFGKYMYQTHDGLSRDYQVSCDELDFLVDLTKNMPQVYGSRMMGGGFGGCTINIIENDSVAKINEFIVDAYNKKFGKRPEVYVTKIHDGTSIIKEL